MAELEKLGAKYRIALKIIKDPRFERLTCTHKGSYADDWYYYLTVRSSFYDPFN